MQQIRGNNDDVLSRNDLRDDEKVKRYFQLQNRYLAFKRTIKYKNTTGRNNQRCSRLNIKHTASLATTALSTPLNPFNVTPELTQAAISQKPDKESFTPPPPLNPAFLTPPPTVETTITTWPESQKASDSISKLFG